MKKIIIVILLLFTTSCINYTELNNLAIVKSIGINYQNNNYTLYIEIYDEIKKDNNPKIKILELTANNINELFNKLEKISNKEIYLSHIDLLVLDDNLNNNNYQEIINYFINDNNIRNDFNYILTKDVYTLFKNSQYNEIENFLKSNHETKEFINHSFNNAINSYLKDQTFIVSMINYNNNLIYDGNYQFNNNKIERINNEKN